MRRATLLATAALLVLSACDGHITGPDSRLTPDGPSWSSDPGEGYLMSTGTQDGGSFDFFDEVRADGNGGQFQFLGGQFTLATGGTTEAVEAHFWMFNPGDLNVVIRADEDGLPGEAVASSSYSVGGGIDGDWVVFEDYGVNLAAGTYWLSFEPVPGTGFWGVMQSGAEHPLSAYGLTNQSSGGWVSNGSNPGYGMRIRGTVSEGPDAEATPIPVPDQLRQIPTQLAEVDLNQGSRNSLEALVKNSLRKFEAGELEPGCGMLQALLNQLKAQSGQQVPAHTAQDLIGQLEAIQAQIGC